MLSLVLLSALVSGCGLVDAALGRATYTIPSESMEPTIKKGSRLSARRVDEYAPRLGDIVVYRPPKGWTGTRTAGERLGRVIGVPGSRVSCCDAGGRLEVNGKALEEPYLAVSPASELRFDVQVPRSRLWIMGDNRPVSIDSRSHRDAPGGGTVGVSDVTAVADVPGRP